MLNSGCLPSITGGFSQFLAAPAIAKSVELGLEAEIREGKTEPYDSHPPLRDRIAEASKLALSSPPDDDRPAECLLADTELAELQFLEALNPDFPKNGFRRVAWEESGPRFLIPSWTAAVSENAKLLQGITSGNLPASLGRILDIAAEMRNPRGMLLNQQQMIPYARQLVATAFALALVNHGWALHSSPGEFYLEKNGKQIQPFQLLQQVFDGTLKNEAWTEKCREYEIGEMELVPAATGQQAAAASQSQPPLG